MCSWARRKSDSGMIQIIVCSLYLGLMCSKHQLLHTEGVLPTPFSMHRAAESTRLQDVPHCQPTVHTSALSSQELIGGVCFVLFCFLFSYGYFGGKEGIPTPLPLFLLIKAMYLIIFDYVCIPTKSYLVTEAYH